MRKRSVIQEVKRRVTSTATVRNPVMEETLVCSPDDSVLAHPHRLEQDIRHQLMLESNLNFTSLVVRRINNGVCLEGVLETDDDSCDVENVVRRVADVQNVLNCLVVRRPHELPLKG